MDAPSPTEVRALSAYLARLFPAADPPEDPDPLQPWIDEAVALVSSMTGRTIGDVENPIGSCGSEDVPTGLEPLARRAIVSKIEQAANRGLTFTSRRGTIRAGRLASFSAGSYSESYFGPGEARTSKLLDLDPATHEALWALATECARAYWLNLWSEDPIEPAAAVMAWDYSRRPGGY